MGALVCRKVAVQREGLPSGGAGVGAVVGMGAHVSRQAFGFYGGRLAQALIMGALTVGLLDRSGWDDLFIWCARY
jgi:hypothetical protein